MNGIIVACGGSIIAAIVALITLFAQRKWQKEDRTADRISELSGKIDKVGTALDNHIKKDAEQDARWARRRIINFADECRRDVKHSSEHFDSILDDITFYKKYCDEHQAFKNEKAVHSIKYIEDVYDKTKRENSFI